MTSNDVKIVESPGRENGKVQYSTRKDKTRQDTTWTPPKHTPLTVQFEHIRPESPWDSLS
jgi:hypothetical protein